MLLPWLNLGTGETVLVFFWTPDPTARSSAQSAPREPQEACGGENVGLGTQEAWVSRFSQDQLGDLGPVLCNVQLSGLCAKGSSKVLLALKICDKGWGRVRGWGGLGGWELRERNPLTVESGNRVAWHRQPLEDFPERREDRQPGEAVGRQWGFEGRPSFQWLRGFSLWQASPPCPHSPARLSHSIHASSRHAPV